MRGTIKLETTAMILSLMNIYNQSGVNMEKTQTTVAEERVSRANDNTVV